MRGTGGTDADPMHTAVDDADPMHTEANAITMQIGYDPDQPCVAKDIQTGVYSKVSATRLP